MSQDEPSGSGDVLAPIPSAPTKGLPDGFYRPGQVLGDRYQIRWQLGRGGMGEVWRACDLKLRVEVALKALREDLFRDGTRRDLLRREVRAAREVVSPNVCRIFDLIEADGRELVSMEYVDGQTLLGVLRERAPLELKEAQDIASQFLAGLEAIHSAGLVHRDVKPENIMLTRSGRVVVMDFGLARQEAEGSGSVSGTPAYMAPEQAAGLLVDARADVYSAGVVLAEMVSPGGVKDLISRQSVWEGVRQEPARVPDTPWAPVLKRAVAKEPDHRFNSAHTLTRALEEVTLRVEGAEDLTPYPGLASFTEDDAEYFFGREAEVESLWARLDRPHLLAIVGPSGAGKTSFIRAGVIPNAGSGWGIATCSPGNAAFRSLRQELATRLAGDAEAMRELVDVEELDATVSAVSRWRRRSEQAILIVDQFEELFTQNPAEAQARFAELLGRLVLEADVFVLLSLRDDFFFQCHQYEALKPVVTDLTLLGPPTGASLRRALVRPATKCGYRFEDDDLVEEMLGEVKGERGALPLLAFAMSRMWDERDRENGLITRRAYNDIGGVGGALARHAENTIDRIGSDRIVIVRELFRNLVTAEGTRAVREWAELLSVFEEGQRQTAEKVLRELIEARLLTSYEIRENDRDSTRSVEIIHESLLANWPRLVRWQTQDADAVQLRDQLRQAARTWQEHDRSDDLLWTGLAFTEYLLWRERYPGGLTETEEAFACAMTSLATRRRRRRRAAVGASFGVLLIVLAVIGGFWRRSVIEARRAEAANLFSLAQLRLEEYPSATIAYAIASLELADNPEVRRLVVEALWLGPTEVRLPTCSPYFYSFDFSHDGLWLATIDPGERRGSLWPSDGGPPTVLEGGDFAGEICISPRGDLVAASLGERRELGLWSFPEGRFLSAIALGDRGESIGFQFSSDGQHLITSTQTATDEGYEIEVRSWPVTGGAPDLLTRLEVPEESGAIWTRVDPTGSRLAWADGRRVRIARLEGSTVHLASAISVKHDRAIAFLAFDGNGRQLVTADAAGAIRIWSLESDPPELTHTLDGYGGWNALLWFDPPGSMLAGAEGLLWDLTGSLEAEPLQLRHSDALLYGLAFDPESKWLVTSAGSSVSFWPLGRPYPRVLRGHEDVVTRVVFTPDGERLVSASEDGTVRVWPLRGSSGGRSQVLYRAEGVLEAAMHLAVAPDGSCVAIGCRNGRVMVLPLDGRPVRDLGDKRSGYEFCPVAVGPRARLVAAGSGDIVRIWDLESEEVRILDAGDGMKIRRLDLAGDGALWVGGRSTLRRWSLDGERPRILEEIDLERPELVADELCDVDLDRRQVLLRKGDRLWIKDLESDYARELGSYGSEGSCLLDATRQIVVTNDGLGTIRVGPTTGGEPHLLLGPEQFRPALSPDGRWIASGGDDGTIRLWPMPDLSKPPIHTLPREELIAKLKTLTNLRVVRDPSSSSGWTLTHDPFPGWETVPSW